LNTPFEPILHKGLSLVEAGEVIFRSD